MTDIQCYMHPDRNGNGPFLWIPITKGANPGGAPSDLQYWAFSAELTYLQKTTVLDAQTIEDYGRRHPLTARLVPSRTKSLGTAVQEKRSSGYQLLTPGLTLEDLFRYFFIKENETLLAFGRDHLGPTSHLLEFYYTDPSRLAGVEGWRQAQLVTVPWS